MAVVNAQSNVPKPAAARKGAAPVVPEAVLEHLAKLARPAGIALLLLRPDGNVAWHDHGAGVLYERFMVPALKHTELLANQLRSLVSKTSHTSSASVSSSPFFLEPYPALRAVSHSWPIAVSVPISAAGRHSSMRIFISQNEPA